MKDSSPEPNGCTISSECTKPREQRLKNATDALHLAAAYIGGAEELITTEKRSKPIYRSSLVKVVYLYEGR